MMGETGVRTSPVWEGTARGELVVSQAPICFWGAVDPASAVVTEPGHPMEGRSLAGRILVFPGTKGSSSSSGVLLELVRVGRAPAALIVRECEPILSVAASLSRIVYDFELPVGLLWNDQDIREAHGTWELHRDGRLVPLNPKEPSGREGYRTGP